MMKYIVLALALGLSTADRNFAPRVSASINKLRLGDGFNPDDLGASVEVESAVTDDLKVGVDLNQGSNPIQSVFAKVSQKFGDGNVDADLRMNVGDNRIHGDVEYQEGDNSILAKVNSAGGKLVERVEFTRKSVNNGLEFMFKPTFHVDSKDMDLETSADLNDKTNVNVKLSHGGKNADLEVNHRLDDETAIKVEYQPMSNDAQVEVERKIDNSNTVKPRVDLSSRHLTCSWVRKLNGDRTATVTVDPNNSVDLELESDDDADWKATFSAPWDNPKDANIKLGRKFQF